MYHQMQNINQEDENQLTTQDHNSLFYQMLLLDDYSLQILCQTDTEAAALCKDEDFWKQKSYRRHGNYNKTDSQPYDVSWKRIYLDKPMVDTVEHPDNIWESKKWYDNGQLETQVFHKDGVRDGWQFRWYNNGQLSRTLFFTNGNSEGKQSRWYDNGQLSNIIFYKDGLKEGGWLGWYENGQLSHKHSYKNNKKEGDWLEWHANGQLSHKSIYTDNNKGNWSEWYDNGQLSHKYLDTGGKQESLEWHKNGNKKSRFFYNNGNVEEQAKWCENGQLRSIMGYKDGKYYGGQFGWDENGQQTKHYFVNDNQPVTEEEMGEINPEWETILRGGVVIQSMTNKGPYQQEYHDDDEVSEMVGIYEDTVAEMVGIANHLTTQDHNSLFYQMLLLDDVSLQSLCLTDTKAAALCKDEDFWKHKSYRRHGNYNKTDSQPYDVSWKRIYIQKPMLEEVEHLDGTRESKKWYGNGQIELQFVSVGPGEGETILWHKNGQLARTLFMKDGLTQGDWLRWYNNGQLSHKQLYKDGLRDGEWLQWYRNGQLSHKHCYKDGVKDGALLKWYENGQKMIETMFKDNVRDGELLRWYENGQLSHKHCYKNGKFDGENLEWSENGQQTHHVFMKDGEVITKELWETNLRSDGSYHDGDEVSEMVFWL
jgi:antitoxin component YwqK of YwqJK toxin-antitoxin module